MDINLKLLVLDFLYDEDDEIKSEIDKIKSLRLQDLVYGENSKYGYFDCIPEALQLLDEIEISQDQLNKVTYLSGEAVETHFIVMPNCDGEGDEFDIKSLAGIEKMPNLKFLTFINFESICDPEVVINSSVEYISDFDGLDENTEQMFFDSGIRFEEWDEDE